MNAVKIATAKQKTPKDVAPQAQLDAERAGQPLRRNTETRQTQLDADTSSAAEQLKGRMAQLDADMYHIHRLLHVHSVDHNVATGLCSLQTCSACSLYEAITIIIIFLYLH